MRTQLVRVQSEMTVILGDLIYRTACAAAAMWAVFIFVITATLSLPDWTIATPHRSCRRCLNLEHRYAPSGMFYPVI
jgi:hypothetical protein